MIGARYDAAQTTDDNTRHWANADGLSARQANSLEVRRVTRERARYEVANNCYARGMVETIADLSVGRGAQLQILRRRGNLQQRTDAQVVERLFDEWADEVGLWAKLWTARVARSVDGEGCGLMRTDWSLESPVKLTIQPLETDHFTSGYQDGWEAGEIDGLDVDDVGNVIRYHVMPSHPAEDLGGMQDPVLVSERAGYLWFRGCRPGQLRGVSELLPALPLFALLRRFTLATLHAAETAANFAGVLETTGPGSEQPAEFERIEFERNALLTLPAGAKLGQLQAQHPATTYEMFKLQVLCEIARCLQLPRGLALLDSSNYNYSSGRLDRQGTDQFLAVDHQSAEAQILRKAWRAWLSEARLVDGYLPESYRQSRSPVKVRWLWSGLGHVDRQKEAAGTEIDLRLCRTTLADECARDGRDWEEVLEQRAEEIARQTQLGLHQTQGPSPSNTEVPYEDEEEATSRREPAYSG